ncbi:glycosyltransferase 87 family protein [Arthrobacter wenxiniae]|jgi:uncharacterized membrane protein|uniref:DUF2029 domain-containing protein n=1 Tax=Arthrobacter wenxiniae TaxID=2713570 RepID=A0A7Y7II84_9MICC|nr:glycosyltransferase 87 family protein [Arthrobacter wenxiniae]NVM95969.1 DUF2029 domain-containing protein [Arthrobacter wenxiniae]
MADSQAPGRQRRQGIAVPSRSDPLLRAMTGPVGGPMGRRTAPGLISPGFFTVERVLVLMAAVSAILAVLSKGHCRQTGWTTPDQYSTVCWSEIPNSLAAHDLGRLFPFFTAGTTFDHPPLVAVIAASTAWLSGGFTGEARQLAYFDINAALLAAVWIFTVVVAARTAGRRPWDAAIIAASPLLWLTAYVSWDFWAVALVALGLYLFARRRPLWAGFMLGVAAMAAPYALLVLLALLVLGVRNGQATRSLELLAAGAVGWLMVLAPVAVVNPSGWGAYAASALTGDASQSSLYGGWNLVAARVGLPTLGDDAVNVLAVFLLALLVLGVVALGLYAPRRPRAAQLAAVAVAGFIVVNKFTEPWHAIWLLPLLALALPRWRPVLCWQAAVAAHFIALLLFQGKELGHVSDQHAIDMPYFVLAASLAGIASCFVAGLLVRDMWQPQRDAVRRGGVDDPQGGVLLEPAPAPALGGAPQSSGPDSSGPDSSGARRHG